ncbi:MAG: hypothetical protein WC900_10005 [Oscillospiraceae bacterium]|jgi:hypothetical protein
MITDLILDDKELRLVVNNVAVTPDGLKLFGHLLAMSGAFSRGITGTDKDIYNKGRSDFGLEIREMLLKHAFQKYVEILKEGEKEDE